MNTTTSVLSWTILLMLSVLQSSVNSSADDSSSEFFSFTLNDIKGNPVPFEQFRGKVTLLVNTASQCGYTESHLKSLKRLHDILSHGDKFNVVVFPCNEFGEQEPWDHVEIEEYYRGHFKIEFIILEKGSVADSPLWKWVKANSVGPSWNFHKYLINGKGQIIQNWPADVNVESIFTDVQSLVDSVVNESENPVESEDFVSNNKEEL